MPLQVIEHEPGLSDDTSLPRTEVDTHSYGAGVERHGAEVVGTGGQ